MFRIIVFLTVLTVSIGCYPPSYYDHWNAPSTQRYLDWLDQQDQYNYYSPSVYYNPYYYPYPYSYLPFFFSFSYSYSDFDYPSHRFYHPGPYDGRHYRGWWRR